MKAHAVILNPASGGGKGLRRWKALLESSVGREAGLGQAALFDGGAGVDSLDAWVEAQLRQGARRFVAAGGDGTVNLALNALLGARDRVGLDPGKCQDELRFGAVGLGSSNDFQKPYDAPGRVAVGDVRCRLAFERAEPHDLGRVRLDGSQRARHFVINASVGVTAEANWNFNDAGPMLRFLKRNWVDGAIVVTALRTFVTYRNFKARLSTGGGAAREVVLTNLGVVKNVHFSGQMRYDVPQPLDDGLFGVHLCEGMGRLEMVKTLSALDSGRFSGLPKTSSGQSTSLMIEADEPFAVETDGEVVRARSARFEALRKELRVCP